MKCNGKIGRINTLRMICAAGLSAMAMGALAEPVMVINAGTAAHIDDETAMKIFLRQVKTFVDGTSASPVMQKEGALTEAFRGQVLKKTQAQMKAYWAQQVFTGSAKPPPTLDDDEAVLKFVAETPGGIGYVESGKSRAGVKVIKR